MHETNPISGNHSSFEATSSLPNVALSSGQDVFGQPLSKAPAALGRYEHPLLKSDDSVNGTAPIDPLTGLPQQSNKATLVYGDEFESGIPPIDHVAHLAGKTMDAVDKAVESGASVVKEATHTAVTQIAEKFHESISTAQEQWNAPDNQLRTIVHQRVNQAGEFIKQKAFDVAARQDFKDVVHALTELGRTALEKAGDFIETAQSATEDWVNQAFDSSYIDRSLTAESVSRAHSAHPFMGVIDTDFRAQSHGAQVVNAIQHSSQRLPDWSGEGVGTGHWADALVRFVDAAKASGRPGAIVNLSFDLVQINPDGSMTTRSALTDEEQAALAYAQEQGVLIVASAGNQDEAMSALGQASQTFGNIITVGAARGNHRADYSSYGKGLDLLAPGRVSNSALAGTSLAAAEVTAAITQIWAANPELNAEQVSQILASTAKDLNTPGWDAQTGFGLLDQSAAIQEAKITQPEKEQPFETTGSRKFASQDSTWNSTGAIASERINSIGITVKAGDTLWGISQRELGDGSRWREVRKSDGSSFTEHEANQLQIGTGVYLPDNSLSRDSATTSTAPSQSTSSQPVADSPSFSNPSSQPIEMKAGETLWGIAEKYLGNGDRWTELKDQEGNSFDPAEVSSLPVGTKVYLPSATQPHPSALPAASKQLPDQAVVTALRTAIIGQESGGNYKAVNKDSGALGIGQILPANVASWSRAALGREVSQQEFLSSPDLQIKIIDYKLNQYYQQAKAASNGATDIAVRRVASAWYSGQPDWYTSTKPQGGGKYPSIADYTHSVLGRFYKAQSTASPSSTAVPVSYTEQVAGHDSRTLYRVMSGQTLSGIAQERWGDASLWKQIEKEDGSKFTEAEARQLQAGETVYLPGASAISSVQVAGQGGTAINSREGYIIQQGDTLTAIAQQKLGNRSRWQEITKADGTPFTEQEARQLPVGVTIYLPTSSIIGGMGGASIGEKVGVAPIPPVSGGTANEGTANGSVPRDRPDRLALLEPSPSLDRVLNQIKAVENVVPGDYDPYITAQTLRRKTNEKYWGSMFNRSAGWWDDWSTWIPWNKYPGDNASSTYAKPEKLTLLNGEMSLDNGMKLPTAHFLAALAFQFGTAPNVSSWDNTYAGDLGSAAGAMEQPDDWIRNSSPEAEAAKAEIKQRSSLQDKLPIALNAKAPPSQLDADIVAHVAGNLVKSKNIRISEAISEVSKMSKRQIYDAFMVSEFGYNLSALVNDPLESSRYRYSVVLTNLQGRMSDFMSKYAILYDVVGDSSFQEGETTPSQDSISMVAKNFVRYMLYEGHALIPEYVATLEAYSYLKG